MSETTELITGLDETQVAEVPPHLHADLRDEPHRDPGGSNPREGGTMEKQKSFSLVQTIDFGLHDDSVERFRHTADLTGRGCVIPRIKATDFPTDRMHLCPRHGCGDQRRS